MRLEDYWGVGPATSDSLASELGVEDALAAIEDGDRRALVDAGLSPWRATRILRHAHGGAGMDRLATSDARDVYTAVLDRMVSYAVTDDAADRIRILTPLSTADAIEGRLDDIEAATEAWADLEEGTREAVLTAFDGYGDGSERAAVETALRLREVGVEAGPFGALTDLDPGTLEEAAATLAHLDGDAVRAGADDRLDALRERRDAVRDLRRDGADLLEDLQAGGVRDTGEFREAFLARVTEETGATRSEVREAMPVEAADAEDFVLETLRALVDDLSESAAEREREVATDLRETVADARGEVDAAVEAVEALAFRVSVARFALDFGLTRPTIAPDSETLAVVNARNLELLAADETVQPVSYAVGDHDESGAPTGDRVAVLTGANSGGKTTLLETLCQVAVLAHMGLPVPAEAATVGLVDAIVFHRRHASFDAGVLESTLRTIVPPLAERDRTLMLVDEFEAITEPGSAADLLHGLVTLTVDRADIGVFVTHLADDLSPLPEAARVDGIFAEGLDENLELAVDYQPRFDTVGRSTPEFIVSRLLANADGRERACYETLADAVGSERVQRTLLDAYD